MKKLSMAVAILLSLSLVLTTGCTSKEEKEAAEESKLYSMAQELMESSSLAELVETSTEEQIDEMSAELSYEADETPSDIESPSQADIAVPATVAPAAPATQAPATQAPVTQAPATQAPATQATAQHMATTTKTPVTTTKATTKAATTTTKPSTTKSTSTTAVKTGDLVVGTNKMAEKTPYTSKDGFTFYHFKASDQGFYCITPSAIDFFEEDYISLLPKNTLINSDTQDFNRAHAVKNSSGRIVIIFYCAQNSTVNVGFKSNLTLPTSFNIMCIGNGTSAKCDSNLINYVDLVYVNAEETKCLAVDCPVVMNFSKGFSYTKSVWSFSNVSSEPGKYAVDTGLNNFKFSITYTVRDLSYYIKDVTIPDDFTPDYVGLEPPEKAVIHLTNGTSFSIVPGGYNEHKLQNGKTYSFGFTSRRNEGSGDSVSYYAVIYKPEFPQKYNQYNKHVTIKGFNFA